MKKAVKITLIVLGSICALIVAFIILASVVVLIADITDDKIVPDREDLSSGISSYLYNIDEEHKKALIKEAADAQYPVDWPMLWIVIKRINLDAPDLDGNQKHFDIEMSDEEAEYLLNDMPEMFRDTISEYTNGLVNVKITPVLYDEVTYMENNGDVWLVPKSFPDIGDTFSDYNTVMCTVRVKNEEGDEVRTGWAGMAFTDTWDGNFGFAMAQTSDIPAYQEPSLMALFADNPVPEEVYIHEWLHTFEVFEEIMKNCDGNPDTAGEHGYECLTKSGENGNYVFYEDLLTRNVWDKKLQDYVGMDEELWRTYAMLMDIAKGRVDYAK